MREMYHRIKWNIRNHMMLNDITEDGLYSAYQQITVVVLFVAVLIYVSASVVYLCF